MTAPLRTTTNLVSKESARAFVTGISFDTKIKHPFGHLYVAAVKDRILQAAPANVPTTDPLTPDGTAEIKDKISQSFVIGNGLISFDDGVTQERKKTAIDSTLFAQLYASSLYPNVAAADYTANWYQTYFNTLTNLGWIMQGSSVVHHDTFDQNVDVSQELITLVSRLVGANGAAAVKAVLDALKSLADNSPAITVFREHAETNSVAQMTVSLASEDAKAGFLLKGIEFDLTATDEETQVLFFKWSTLKAQFNYRNIVLSIDDAVYQAVAQAVSDKVKAHAVDFVKRIQIP